MAGLPVIGCIAARILTAYAQYAPDRLRRGKVFRLLGRLCAGHVVTSRYGVRMHVNPRDRTNQLCILGRYSTVPEEIAKLKEGMCFIDIGANAGLFSLMAARRVGEDGLVISFEPSVEQFRTLVRNIEANHCRNVLPLQLAVSDRTTRVAFSSGDRSHTGTHHVSPDGRGDVLVIGVNVTDDFQAVCRLISGKPTVVKIDVEGFERHVLAAIYSVLRMPEVVSVIIEIDDRNLARFNTSREDVEGVLHGLGFTLAGAAEGTHSDAVFRRSLVQWSAPQPDPIRSTERASARMRGSAWTTARGQAARSWHPIRGGLIAAAAITYASVAGLAALVDPYGIVGLVTVPGLNSEKTQRLDRGGRAERSIRLWLSDHETLILGGTRVQLGIDPAGDALASLGAYNAAIPAATIAEIDAIVRFAIRHEQAKRVLIGLDFGMFEADRSRNRDFESSGFDGDWMPGVYARALLHPKSIVDAAQTIYDNFRFKTAVNEPDGFRRNPPQSDYDYRQAFTDILAKEYLVRSWHYADFDYAHDRLTLLTNLLRQLSAAGVKTYVFVPPVHARQLEAIEAKGLYPTYERWLRDITSAVAAAAAGGEPGPRAELWDFSGYNSITTEDVPDWNDAQRKMTWYWDSSHFTAAAGELIVMRMLGTSTGALSPPPDFGVQLTPAIVEDMLGEKRKDRSKYIASHSDEVLNVRRLVARAVLGST